MTQGRAVQVGSADALFERPQHTFVGNFIGSPGMNFLPARVDRGVLHVAGRALALPPGRNLPEGDLKLGVRPEFVAPAEAGDPAALPVTVLQAQDIGTYVLLIGQAGDLTIKARLSPEAASPQRGDTVWLRVLGPQTCFYLNEELVA
jgi:glycerol transport system ATP-binding protein